MSAADRKDLRKGWCPGALRPMAARDGLLVRLKITGGIVPAALAETVADLAERHGNALLDLSARANLQLRGVREASLPALLEGLDGLGLLDDDAGAEAVRNVLSSPLAGLGRHPPPRRDGGEPHEAWWRGPPPRRSVGTSADPMAASREARLPPPAPTAVPLPRFAEEDIPDIRPLVAALERALVADPALHALPTKFGILVDDGGAPSLAGIAADLRFDWVAAERAFAVGLGGTATDALALGLVAPDALVARAIALAHRLLAHPGEPRRLAKLIREIGPEAATLWFAAGPLLVSPGRAAGENPESMSSLRETASRREQRGPASDSPPRNDRRPTTAESVVGCQTISGVPTLGLAAPFGRLDAAMLRAAAALAASGSGELRLTPWRTILVPDVAPGSADLASLAACGFIVDPADPRLRVAACTGQAGCERGSTDTHADAAWLAELAADLAAELAAALPDDGLTLHVSGCAHPSRTAVTLVGRDGRYDLVRDGRPGDDPELESLDLAALRVALRSVKHDKSSSTKRGRGTMRSMVEGAAASTLPVSTTPHPTRAPSRQPPVAIPLPRFAGEAARGET